MRLQRFLARSGVASRRAAEDLIRAGSVRVNRAVATVGMSVDPDSDVVTVGGRRVRPSETVWIALNKPVGHVTSARDDKGRPTVFDLVPSVPGLTYVGRLDIMTSGLLILTNDGDYANRLTHPRYAVEKTYVARVHGRPASQIERELGQPIDLDDQPVRIVRARVSPLTDRSSEIELVLREGRHRIVRRVCDLIGVEVDRLVRTRHGPVRLGRLQVGKWRYLTERELNAVRAVRAA
jgi:23S rRNA pseudouridine2605 synthase